MSQSATKKDAYPTLVNHLESGSGRNSPTRFMRTFQYDRKKNDHSELSPRSPRSIRNGSATRASMRSYVTSQGPTKSELRWELQCKDMHRQIVASKEQSYQ